MYTWRKKLTFFLIMSVKAWGGGLNGIKGHVRKELKLFFTAPLRNFYLLSLGVAFNNI